MSHISRALLAQSDLLKVFFPTYTAFGVNGLYIYSVLPTSGLVLDGVLQHALLDHCSQSDGDYVHIYIRHDITDRGKGIQISRGIDSTFSVGARVTELGFCQYIFL